MTNHPWQLVGAAAAALTSFAFLPQIIKVIRSKSARDVSVVTLFQFTLGISLWIIYGVYLGDKIIIIANSLTLVSLIILLFLYLCYGGKR